MTILVIGAGPGGYETALEAASRGAEEVTLVHEGPLGGVCLNEGCIPTKTFCSAVSGRPACSDLSDIQARKSEVVEQLQAGIGSMLARAKVRTIRGRARFTDPKTVCVDGQTLTADRIVIATGSHPASLSVPGADLPGILDSTDALALKEAPKSLCIIGGGVIGLEFASVFSKLGTEVSVVEYAKGILPRFDSDVAKRLRLLLEKSGIRIETSAAVSSITTAPDGYAVNYECKGSMKSICATSVLMAVGRRPNVEDLGLETAGIEFGPKGIVVDENMCTSAEGVYAIGDVCGGMMLAHTAKYQGRRALCHIFGEKDGLDFSAVPAAVFTEPELATIGLCEDDAKAQGLDFKCIKSFYRACGKAVAMGQSEGLCKIVADNATGRVLGCTILGAHASDIIHEIATLMHFGGTLADLKDIIHAHPTLSEILS